MGSSVKLECKKGVIRGTRRLLKRYAKSKNIPDRCIKRDSEGWFIKAIDRSSFYK